MTAKKKSKKAKRTRAHSAITGHPVTKEYAAKNKATTVAISVQRAAWRGWAVQLENGKLLAEGPADPRPMLFSADQKGGAVGWANAEDGDRVVPVRVIVGR